MIGSPYGYASEKFSNARHSLMLPHPRGEAASIAAALMDCDLGLRDIKPEHLDDSAAALVRTLNKLMDDSGISDPDGIGTFQLRAEQLTEEDQRELSRVVDELAYWFHAKSEEALSR
jgi:hypothetical protein